MHESRPDLEIIFDLAQRLGLREHFFGGDVEAAFNHQLNPSGLTVQELRQHPAGKRVPVETTYHKYRQIDPQTGRPRGFQTPTGRIEIFSTTFARAGHAPLPVVWQPPVVGDASECGEYPLALTFSRLVQYVDDQHRGVPRLRRQVREPFLEIHPTTASTVGVSHDEWVVLEDTQRRDEGESEAHNVGGSQSGGDPVRVVASVSGARSASVRRVQRGRRKRQLAHRGWSDRSDQRRRATSNPVVPGAESAVKSAQLRIS